MNYNEFKLFILETTKKCYSNASVTIREIQKNNNVILDALIIKEQDTQNYTPTIYLNDFYQDYCNNTAIIEILSQIKKIYDTHKSSAPLDMKFFEDFKQVKSKIIFKLINFSKNKQLLEKTPYFKFLDLAVVFYCLVSSDDLGNASILIKNEHLSLWKITKDDLHSYATANTPILAPYEFKEMFDVLNELSSEAYETEDFSMAEKSGYPYSPMYVLSNFKKINGASCILYQNLLYDIAKQIESDYYILPSSIHELIIIPAQNNERYQELSEMVQSVNETQLSPEEFLSDHVYFFSRKTKTVSM